MSLETPAQVRHQVVWTCGCGAHRRWFGKSGDSGWYCYGGCLGMMIYLAFEPDENGNPRPARASIGRPLAGGDDDYGKD